MKIFIKETGEFAELSITDPKTGFEWDEELGAYICDQNTFDFWIKVLNDSQALENRIRESVELHIRNAVNQVADEADNVDTESFEYCVNHYLDDVFIKVH